MSIRQHLWILLNTKEIQTTAWGSLLRAGFDELEKKKQETTQGKSPDHTGSNSTPHHSLEIGASHCLQTLKCSATTVSCFFFFRKKKKTDHSQKNKK